MAKPAKFDRQDVINKATNLYWKKGFHATSMRNLQDVIDMRPGSIYAAFGNKDGLFLEVLKNYTDMGISALADCRAENSSPIAALKAFVIMQVVDTQKDAPNGMCMLAKTVGELTDEHQELLTTARSSLLRIEQAFVSLIEEAQSLGEISQDKDAKRLASHVMIQINGLRTYATANNGNASLNDLINDMFTQYPF
ncbi:TetR/AcrR family transcriptional regulator [Colwellia sp. E2M01]|uniref:TetR/AcrR family transcriptional regulator n=1 Tax=Colwellia sp. E2M01 TaxID=2841561 RepID=UPI001C09F4AB|nr:TetR/AcrR family transcriptional regulator [Colwellia sp. E2M01]MBU2871860.1 TetR/AcrR family transcriptional regulator [Colwellia sp. E2M01]